MYTMIQGKELYLTEVLTYWDDDPRHEEIRSFAQGLVEEGHSVRQIILKVVETYGYPLGPLVVLWQGHESYEKIRAYVRAQTGSTSEKDIIAKIVVRCGFPPQHPAWFQRPLAVCLAYAAEIIFCWNDDYYKNIRRPLTDSSPHVFRASVIKEWWNWLRRLYPEFEESFTKDVLSFILRDPIEYVRYILVQENNVTAVYEFFSGEDKLDLDVEEEPYDSYDETDDETDLNAEYEV